MPHAKEVQKILLDLDAVTLRPYHMPGNKLCMTNYEGLQLPWMLPQKVSGFDQDAFVRHVWNAEGKPDPDGSYMSGEEVKPIEDLENGLGTASSVTRWRQANPNLAHTEKDCVVEAMAEMRGILGPHVKDIITVGPIVLLLLKRL
jgi:trans-aconitate 3-methyltransferase